jgi:5-methylcytosine-specific restriction enzyme subunit McrC
MIQITISEYGYIGCDNVSTTNKFVGNRDLEPTLFQELYDFWLSDEESQKVLTFVNKKCLKATSYVGVIQTKNLSIEILPKTFNGSNVENNRRVFIEMLKVTLGMNEIVVNRANLSTTKSKNIYELFITLFIESMDRLIHRGLKSEYIRQEGNQQFLKGKLKFNEHIRKNAIHKERFYVEYDEYLQDRVENRVLKSTLQLLLKKSRDVGNKRALRQQLFVFDEVDFSINHRVNFSKVKISRGMNHYDLPLRFAKVFLLDESFSSLRGTNDIFALLFPMQTLFEKYMEFVLENSKESLEINKVLVNGGKNEYLLENKLARLQPDYILKMNSGKDIICDAKWKLDTIGSNDIYQIFAYHHFYNARDTAYVFIPAVNGIKRSVWKYIDSRKKIRIFSIELFKVIQNGHKF